MASLKILSPKTLEYKFSSASISLNIANTDTGSVADIKDPNAKLYYKSNFGDQPLGKQLPHIYSIKLVEKIAINVPKNEYIKTVPIFLKNGFFYIL
jgi:hypothetical protein